MKRQIVVFGCVLLVALALTGCLGRQAPIVSGPITQEEVTGNAKWNVAYQRFFDVKRDGPVIPGLRQGLVPQGLEYLPDQDWFLIAGYRDDNSSLVTIIEAATGKLVKTVSFTNQNGSTYTGHAGGLAISDRFLWISSGEKVYYVELDRVVSAADGAILRFAGHLPVDARGSFMSVTDGVLWVGDFALGSTYPTHPHHHLTNRDGVRHSGWIAGYSLDPVTGLIPDDQPRNQRGDYIPDYALSIRDKIQGSYILGHRIILTESYGRNNPSHLFVYENPLSSEPHATVNVSGAKVPVWFLDDANLLDTWTLPPMVESVVQRGDEIYMSSESAALKYLNGSYALSRLQVLGAEHFTK